LVSVSGMAFRFDVLTPLITIFPQGLHHFLGFSDFTFYRSGLHPEYFCLLAKFGMPAATVFLHVLNVLLQKNYLDTHKWQSEVLQSFVPTFLVSVLAILIPLLLLLIAKKGHTIITLSALHDLIMTRYYKFLVVNLLVFFCVGTLALQSFLVSVKSYTDGRVIDIISNSFPSAGPFYVGWCNVFSYFSLVCPLNAFV